MYDIPWISSLDVLMAVGKIVRNKLLCLTETYISYELQFRLLSSLVFYRLFVVFSPPFIITNLRSLNFEI